MVRALLLMAPLLLCSAGQRTERSQGQVLPLC